MPDPKLWRVGRKIPLNVYEGDRPVCQCHTETDAQRIVDAVNGGMPEEHRQRCIRAVGIQVNAYCEDGDPEAADEFAATLRFLEGDDA